ncbi:MAG: hypothetical protein NXH82_06855 [Rhodobacteraceae bacterium]|nr:hypothetical protein [Paracoccaceae bacterium]
MFKSLTAMVLMTALVAGCGLGQSRLNPFNWFGSDSAAPAESDRPVNPLLPERSRMLRREDEIYAGTAIGTVTEVRVERTLSGAIIHATGVADRQGGYDLRLTPLSADETPVDGVLSYSFDVVMPVNPRPVGPERSRRLTVARSLSQGQLEGVRVIRVTGARNAREVRRR